MYLYYIEYMSYTYIQYALSNRGHRASRSPQPSEVRSELAGRPSRRTPEKGLL